jgi:hypothetical protein
LIRGGVTGHVARRSEKLRAGSDAPGMRGIRPDRLGELSALTRA